MKRVSPYLFGLCFILLAGAWLIVLRAQQEFAQNTLLVNSSWYFLFCCLYLVTILKYKESSSLKTILPILIGSVIARVVFAFADVTLTSDIPRYLWEGSLIREGLNPYILAPNAPELAHYRNELWELIEYKQLTAIYPPAALLILAGSAWTALSWKLTLCVFEVLSIAVILFILRRKNQPAGYSLFYSCLPLALTEIAASGHLEGVLIFFTLSAYAAFLALKEKSNFLTATCLGVSMAVAILVKYSAGLFAILLIARNIEFLRRRSFQVSIFISLIVAALICVPFLNDTTALFSSLTTYIKHWRFNDSALHLIGFIFDVNWNEVQSFSPIKLTLFLCWLLFTFSQIRSQRKVVEIACDSYLVFLLLSAVVHPWYGLWFAIFLPFYPSAAPLYFALALPLSYSAQLLGLPDVPLAIKVIEYVPVYGLLFFRLASEFSSHVKSKVRT